VAQITGGALAPPMAASSGPIPKAPGFAGGYLPVSLPIPTTDQKRLPSLAALCEIAHPLEQFLYVGKPKLGISRPAVLSERMKQARCDLIALDRLGFGKERAHVVNKTSRRLGRQFYIQLDHRRTQKSSALNMRARSKI
jgi:hypothetical protein